MNDDKQNIIYFLGVGGIGMSALARYYLAQGYQVFGYDKTKTDLTIELEKEGVVIHYEENLELLDELFSLQKKSLICYTPAIPSTNKEFEYFKKNGFKLYKRSEILGLITQNYFTIAIAGTHGKTTTSSMVAHILNECGVDCVAFLGGISLNINSNLLLNNKAKVVVVEADEYDRSFLTLSPDIALITSLDADHLDIYGDDSEMQNAYKEFVKKIKQNGKLITKKEYIDRFNNIEDIDFSTYSLDKHANTYSTRLSIFDGAYYADIESENKNTFHVKVGLPGIHNVENAIGAFAIAQSLGIDEEEIKHALSTYKGVKRRFEYHIQTTDIVYIDDYAHHPSELEVCIQSVRDLYPNKKITGVFQPHLYSRTKDFADEFAESLSLLDELILLDIYPARELPIEGVTSQLIADKTSLENKIVLSKENLVEHLKRINVEVLLTLGAGDIDTLINPIKEMFQVHE